MRSIAGRIFLVWLLVAFATPLFGVSTLSARRACDVEVDPACADYDPTFDPGFCDPYFDPTCDPGYDPTFEPGFCDPTFDPTCDPGYDPTLDPTLDPGFCDPFFDPTCDPGYDPTLDPGFCDPFFDPTCDEAVPNTTIPRALAFEEPHETIDAIGTRDDTTDDVDIDEIPSDEVATVAASRLVLGVDALAELGAFERVIDPELNSLVREIRTQVAADGLTDDGYRREIERLADDLPQLIGQLEADGLAVSPAVREVAESLDEETVEAISSGETSVIAADVWVDALADLVVRGGAAPADGEDRDDDDSSAVLGMALLFAADEPTEPAEQPVVTDQTTTTTIAPTTSTAAPTTTTPVASAPADAGAAGDEAGDSSVLLLVGGAIAGLLGLVAFLLIRRRSAEHTEAANAVAEAADHKLSVNDLLDASRRMTASLDVDEICAIAIAETERLVDGEGGMIAVRTADGLSPSYATPAELFRLEAIDQSSLVRVTETGQSITTVATSEAVLVEVPMAMAAVPIVSDGSVTGAIMVVRVASNPFGRDDLEALEMLAPLVGSAFTAAQAHGSATELADVEPMTGLKNRRRLDRDLASTGDALVAYIMLDVDHFKNFNDVNGHAAGDEALRRVATTLAASVRPGDVVYRYGGEEFCVLLPDMTADEAADVAERIRAGVEACVIPGEENQPSGTVTVSIGVADTSTKPVGDLVERADAALYEAKDSGRNQVVVDLTDD